MKLKSYFLVCIVIVFSHLFLSLCWADNFSCEGRAETAKMLWGMSSGGLLADNDCRIKVYKAICEYSERKFKETHGNKNLTPADKRRQELSRTDLFTSCSTMPDAKVRNICEKLNLSGALPDEFDLGEFDF